MKVAVRADACEQALFQAFGEVMADNESCRYVKSLIPKYIKGQCTKVESMLLEEHCANCQECRRILHQAIERSKGTSVKEVLFLTRPRRVKVFSEPGLREEMCRTDDTLSSIEEPDAEEYIDEEDVIPELIQPNSFRLLLLVAAVIIAIAAAIALRNVSVKNYIDEHQTESFESEQAIDEQQTESFESTQILEVAAAREDIATYLGGTFASVFRDYPDIPRSVYRGELSLADEHIGFNGSYDATHPVSSTIVESVSLFSEGGSYNINGFYVGMTAENAESLAAADGYIALEVMEESSREYQDAQNNTLSLIIDDGVVKSITLQS